MSIEKGLEETPFQGSVPICVLKFDQSHANEFGLVITRGVIGSSSPSGQTVANICQRLVTSETVSTQSEIIPTVASLTVNEFFDSNISLSLSLSRLHVASASALTEEQNNSS